MDISISNPKRTFGFFAVGFALLSFIQFLIYYVCVGFLYESTFLLTAMPYVINFIEGLLVPLSATVVFLTKGVGIKNKILPLILISLTRIAYTFPYYYIYYVSDYFNTSEALLLALLISILYVLFFFLQTFICNIVINAVLLRKNENAHQPVKTKLFNLEDQFNFGILLCTVFIFVIFFARECVNTVSYFIEVGSGYTAEEILTIIISYVLLPLFAFIHYTICAFVKNKLILPNDKQSADVQE